MVRRQQYTTDTLADAVDQVCAGESPTKVASLLRIPLRTLTKQVKPSRSGAYLEQARRGLLPMLTEEEETYLVEWIKSMQFHGTSAARLDVLHRASEMVSFLQSKPIAVSDGWY